MKKVKVLAVILTLIMSIGLLSSCGKKTETPAPTTTAPATTAPATTAPAATASVYKDGVYKVSFDNFDKNGWKGQVELEVKGDKITNVIFDYVNKDGKLKTQDEAYKKAMEPVTKTYPAKFIPELQQSLLDKQDIAAVDAVAGATGSSNNFKALVGSALDMAKTGDTAPKTIPTPAE